METKQNFIHKFLRGTEEENIMGTILGIRKIKSKSNEHPFAVLLYFDHRTARIERFLTNPTNLNEYNQEIEKFHIDRKEGSFALLDDGKLNNNFFNIFMFELVRDYFRFPYSSFMNTDMNYLRSNTLPLTEHTPEDIAVGVGITLKEKFPNANIYQYGTKPINPKVYFQLDLDKPFILNTPINLKTTPVPYLESKFNIQTRMYTVDKNAPRALSILASQFNTKTITNLYRLNDQVHLFNNQLLTILNNNTQN